MDKVVHEFNAEELVAAYQLLKRLDSVPLEEVVINDGDRTIRYSETTCKQWRFVGLNNSSLVITQLLESRFIDHLYAAPLSVDSTSEFPPIIASAKISGVINNLPD